MLVCCHATVINQLGLVDWREVCFTWPQPIDRFFFFGIDTDENFFLELVAIKQGVSDNIKLGSGLSELRSV